MEVLLSHRIVIQRPNLCGETALRHKHSYNGAYICFMFTFIFKRKFYGLHHIIKQAGHPRKKKKNPNHVELKTGFQEGRAVRR